MVEEKVDYQTDLPILKKFFRTASHDTYTEPEPIVDATSDFEQMDRGDGFGVDDEKTYHRTEK